MIDDDFISITSMIYVVKKKVLKTMLMILKMIKV